MDQHREQHRLTARGVAMRSRIIEAAADLVRRNGAAGTGLEAVMASSGASKSQLYHYFADKEDLVTAVIEWQTQRVLAANEPLLKDLDSFEGLLEWRNVLVEGSTAAHGAGGCPLGSLVGELAERPRQRAALAAGFARWEHYLRDGFMRMRDRGELDADAVPADLAVACLAALQGGLLLAQTERSSTPLAIALDMALALVAAHRQPRRNLAG